MYDWKNKTWEDEDKEFAPKRRVNNKGADKKPHIIGSFYSDRMQRIVEFESLNEDILYNIFEMDRDTIRYYVQPVKIEIPYFDERGNPRTWIHVSDALAFRQGLCPHLFQIKDILDKENEKLKNCNINKACLSYAEKRGWDYSVIRPKQLPNIILNNIEFLSGFIRKRNEFDEIIPKLVSRLTLTGTSTVNELAKSMENEISHIHCLPVIFHLIATQVFDIDANSSINGCSYIKIASQESTLSSIFIGGMTYEMEQY